MTSTIHADKIMNSSGDQDSGVDLLVNDQVKIKTANTDRITVTDSAASMGDNFKLRLGAGNDLDVYHDGSNSYLEDTGTGDLKIKGSVIRVLSDQINLSNNANTIDGLTIDSSGRVKKPKQPAFMAGFSNNDYHTAGTTNGTAYNFQPYTDENSGRGYDIGNDYNNSTFRFTAPIPGRYFFSGQFFTNYSSNYARHTIFFKKNGTIYQVYNQGAWEVTTSVRYSHIFNLTTNDYIEMAVASEDSNATSNTWQYYRATQYTYFQGYFLG